MSSRGNLLDEKYTKAVVELGNEENGVLGYIGNGSKPDAIRALKQIVGSNRMIWTPELISPLAMEWQVNDMVTLVKLCLLVQIV